MAVHRYNSGLNYNLGASASNQFAFTEDKSIGLSLRWASVPTQNIMLTTLQVRPTKTVELRETSQDGELGRLRN